MQAALLVHVAFSTLTAMLAGLLFGRITPWIALAALLGGAAAGTAAAMKSRKADILPAGIAFWPGLFYALVFFAAFRHFLYLLYPDGSGISTLHPNNFGDLTMHIHYLRTLASGPHFWPENPEFAGTVLRYPLGMDLYNALWEAVGIPLETHLFLAGVVMTYVAMRLLHNWMGWWGVGAFFLNGGLYNWRSLISFGFHDFQNAAAWKNFLLSVWITQRGFLFALPAGIFVVHSVTGWLISGRKPGRAEQIAAAFLWSALAWFHLHTFFILSVVLAVLIALRKRIREMIFVLVPAAITGAVFVLFSTGGFSVPGILRVQWGWVAGGENFFSFWLKNLGFWVPLWAISIYLLFIKRILQKIPWMSLPLAGNSSSRKECGHPNLGATTNSNADPVDENERELAVLRTMGALAFTLFFLFTFVMTAPWAWDNIKILLWLYLLTAWVVRKTVIVRLSPAAAVLAGCLVFFPGAVSVVSSMPGNADGVRLYAKSETADAAEALADLPSGAVLAVSPEPNHPAMFLGRKLAMGFPGHLWSHGIDYAKREQEINKIFHGGKEWLSAARNCGVTHIYWSEREKQRYPGTDPEWRYRLKNISRVPDIEVYEISN